MSVAEVAGETRRFAFPVDLGWRNVVFSVRTALAAIVALAIAFWFELSDPQWATLTVYLLAQPTVGAAVAKGAWRTVGTVFGGLTGLVLVAWFSQAAELLVAATVLVVGASFYAGARLRNYASYGTLLAGYTALLVSYEGSSDPLNAWSIAADRVLEILIGIACVTAASTIVMPRYAGDALRAALSRTFTSLATYAATAFRLATPPAAFAAMRRRMIAEVVSFDALRSYAVFEAPEMRVDAWALRRTVREFLVVLSVARGLYVRLDDFREAGSQMVLERIRPTLDAAAGRLERIAADPSAWSDRRRLRRHLLDQRLALRDAERKIEDMAGSVPVDALANGLLILRRSGDVLHELSMVVVAESASLRRAPSAPTGQPVRPRPDPGDRKEALLIALRAMTALSLLSAFWLATAWNMGFTAVSGGSIMLFFAVNQDNPQAGARAFLIWSAVGILVAYAVMIFVFPYLEGYGSLALVLMLVLIPAGLMAGTPSRAWAGIALGGFTISQIGTANVFVPNELALVNSAAALLLGMVCCLAVLTVFPVTSRVRRGQSWARTIGVHLPTVARGHTMPRQAADRIVSMLASLLPRLALDRQSDDDFLTGTLGAASTALELGRLRDAAADPAMPMEAARTIDRFLDQFAGSLERLALGRDRQRAIAEAEAIVADARAAFAGLTLAPGTPATRAVLRAAASLRFIADRFIRDRAYLERSFAGN